VYDSYPDNIHTKALTSITSGYKSIPTGDVDFYQKGSFFVWHNNLESEPNLLRYYSFSCMKHIIDAWNFLAEQQAGVYSNPTMSEDDRVRTIIYKVTNIILLQSPNMTIPQANAFQFNMLDFYFTKVDA
jgi:hypothetical protein